MASETGKGLELKPLLGLAGVLLAALTVEFNDGVSSAALIDARGGLGISQDPGTWFTSLFSTGQVIGMSMATYWALTVSIRHWLLGVIALSCASTVCIPLTSNLGLLYGLRIVQGLGAGFTIPLLLPVALRVLPPPVKLYGLACYALTATFGPNISTALAALWTNLVGWQFVFYEALPLCALAGLLVWYGVEQGPPKYERIRQFDRSGALLVIIGFGAFTTMLEQGDRLDWFNSKAICVLALVSVIALPLLVLNELRVELPLCRFFLLGRRNALFGLIALFTLPAAQPVGRDHPHRLPAAGRRLPAGAVLPGHGPGRRPAVPAAPAGRAAAGLALQSLRFKDAFSLYSRAFAVGPSVSLPIFQGGRLRAMLRMRESQQREAALTFRRTLLQAWQEVDNALTAFAEAQARQKDVANAVAQNDIALRAARQRYAEGVIDFLNVNTAQAQLLQSQNDLASSRTQIATSLVTLYRALGGGWEIAEAAEPPRP